MHCTTPLGQARFATLAYALSRAAASAGEQIGCKCRDDVSGMTERMHSRSVGVAISYFVGEIASRRLAMTFLSIEACIIFPSNLNGYNL